MKRALSLLFVATVAVQIAKGEGKTYWVDGAATNASDWNPGTADQPWKSITRGGGGDVKPGDTVLIRSGVYRETAFLSVTGAPGRPITIAAAPGAQVVVKGSEVVTGPWTQIVPDPLGSVSTAGAFRTLWKTPLDDRFFTDPYFPDTFTDVSKRWVSMVVIDDKIPFQQIGPDLVYAGKDYETLTQVGRKLDDGFGECFWFDPSEQALYVRSHLPYCLVEVGVRAYALLVRDAHNVVLRGLEFRHNRVPYQTGRLAEVVGCDGVVIEDCRFQFADHMGLAVRYSTNCVVRRTDASWNGCVGMTLHYTVDCTVEDCTMKFNNWRRFNPYWAGGGMKSIPANVRATVRRCEAAYNFGAFGIWFDGAWLNKENGAYCNRDIRILDNVCHHNDMGGIFHEVNAGGGVIAGNLCYANNGRGIAVSGFDPGPEGKPLWVAHNTVADNNEGIIVMRRAENELARNVKVANNLLLNNYMPGAEGTPQRGVDVQLEQPADAKLRKAWSNEADGNVYADNIRTPKMRPQWDDDRTLAQWQKEYGQDTHSRQMPVEWQIRDDHFRATPTKDWDIARPLSESVLKIWTPKNPTRVGADRTAWP